MKLLFKQRFMSFLGSYDIYDEAGNTLYTVKGKVGLGHRFAVYDKDGTQVGFIKQALVNFLPKYHIYLGDELAGQVTKKLSIRPTFNVNFNGWTVEGNFMGWDYGIYDSESNQIASVSKELFNFTDTYIIDVANPQNALCALMLVVAIDAQKSSDNSARG